MSNFVTPIGNADVVDVTLSADTSILADNDVIAAPQEVTNFFRIGSGVVKLHSVYLLDSDDQNTDIDIFFCNAAANIGAENAAYAPDDTNAAMILGFVSLLAATHFTDNINSRSAYLGDINLLMKAADDTTSIWVGAVCRSGTPTYTASGLKLKLGIERY